jgi:hypothetical protein
MPHRPSAGSAVRLVALSLFVVASLTACSPTISTFSATAYEQATALKVESRALMGEATEPYEAHAAEVRALRQRLRKAYEFAKGRPKNEISARQWRILIDPEGDLLGGFLRRWKSESSLNAAFVREKQRQVAEAFDTIIGLESGKIKPSAVR